MIFDPHIFRFLNIHKYFLQKFRGSNYITWKKEILNKSYMITNESLQGTLKKILDVIYSTISSKMKRKNISSMYFLIYGIKSLNKFKVVRVPLNHAGKLMKLAFIIIYYKVKVLFFMLE